MLKVVNGGESINVEYKLQGASINYFNKQNVGVTSSNIVGTDNQPRVQNRIRLSDISQEERYNPSQLNQLNENPYSINIIKNLNPELDRETNEEIENFISEISEGEESD